MKNIHFGEVDWNSNSGGGGNKDIFMKLVQGSNVIRVLGNPIQSHVHWVESPNGKRKINSPVDSPALVTRLEDQGFKRKKSWYLRVLDRKEGQFKLIEVGWQIYSGIETLVKSEHWGKTTAYDITIQRGAKGSNPLYQVNGIPPFALKKAEVEAYKEFNADLDIERLIKPSDAAYVCEVMGWDPTPYTSDAPAEETVEDGEFEFDFEA